MTKFNRTMGIMYSEPQYTGGNDLYKSYVTHKDNIPLKGIGYPHQQSVGVYTVYIEAKSVAVAERRLCKKLQKYAKKHLR